MSALDRRLHAFRPDLADVTLQGRVAADRFVEGRPARIKSGAADISRDPRRVGGIETQLLFGEPVLVFETTPSYAWVQGERDGYVGYVDPLAVGERLAPASHQVSAVRTFLYEAPDMKSRLLECLSLSSPVSLGVKSDGYGELAGGGWVFLDHLAPLSTPAPDHVQTARRLLGLPYRWGGKESTGLDCSALVQMALHCAGVPCPRDSDIQSTSLGEAVPPEGSVERGDLLFFPGHVAIALNPEHVVHATAFTMQVCEEPLADVIARSTAESGRGLTAHRRLPARS